MLLVEEEKATAGGARPFINWAKALSGSHKIVFLLYKPGRPLVEALSQEKNIESYSYMDFQNLLHDIGKLGLDILLTHDYIRNLQTMAQLRRRADVRFGVYVQLLFGIHSIADVFTLDYLAISEKFIYKLVRLIPFTLLKKWYVSLLNLSHLVIANSRITATLLHVLYGVEPSGVVYPPVDTEIFRPRPQKRNMRFLLYLGSYAGDTDVKLVTEVAELLRREGTEGLVFGNKTLREYVAKKFRFNQLVDVSDEELAEVYSSSVATLAPQKWETFGYVPVESMACGTPVLTFNVMGASETVLHGRTGWLAENRREFLQYLSSIIKGDLEIDPEYARRHVENHFSLAATSVNLDDIIRRYV